MESVISCSPIGENVDWFSWSVLLLCDLLTVNVNVNLALEIQVSLGHLIVKHVHAWDCEVVLDKNIH